MCMFHVLFSLNFWQNKKVPRSLNTDNSYDLHVYVEELGCSHTQVDHHTRYTKGKLAWEPAIQPYTSVTLPL